MIYLLQINTQMNGWGRWRTHRRLFSQISRAYIQAKLPYLTSNPIQEKLFSIPWKWIIHLIYLITNKWKILALQGYIKKRQTSRCSFGNYKKKTFSVFSSRRVANKKSLNKALDKCLLLYYYLIIQQHTQSTKERKPSVWFLQLFCLKIQAKVKWAKGKDEQNKRQKNPTVQTKKS